MKKLLRFLGYFILVLILLVFWIKFFFPIYSVETESRDNKAKDYNYNYVIVSRFYYSLFKKETGDIVAFQPIKGAKSDRVPENHIWIRKVFVVGNDVSIFPNKDSIENDRSSGYEPSYIDGFDKNTGFVKKEKIIGKVVLTF